MKKSIFLIIILVLLAVVAYAENRIYFDVGKNLEVCDLNGEKTIEQINKEFNGNFTDITAEKKAIEEQNEIITQKKAEIENLIQAKIIEQQRTEAIAELKKEGRLDEEGNIVKNK